MNKKSASIILAFAFTATLLTQAQTSTYPVKKINGKEYYLYPLQAGEGLYTVGKKFNLTPEEITRINPEAVKNLKNGVQLIIPVNKNNTAKTTSQAKPSDSGMKFTEHAVEKKQTVFGICKMYNISIEELKKYNPELEYGLKDGMILMIPRHVTTTRPQGSSLQKVPQSGITHKVQAQETLFAISRRYNVSVEDIINANPDMGPTLETGTELRIPTANSVISNVPQTTTTSTITPTTSQPSQSHKFEQQTISIAYLLPFMLDQEKKESHIDRFADFYAGALLALGKAKAEGISFNIYTFDTDKSEDRINEILQNPELKNVDLIIGPAFSNQIPAISNFAAVNHIHTLIPFSARVAEIEKNPYLFQFNPGTDAELDQMIQLLTETHKDAHILFAQIPGVAPTDEGKILSINLINALTASNRKFDTLALSDVMSADFTPTLVPGVKNIIIFNTDKYYLINPYLPALKNISSDYEATTYLQYSWKSTNNQLPHGIYLSPFMKNMNDSLLAIEEKMYNANYGKANSSTSPRYDIIGYDLTNYFVELISRYGKKFPEKTAEFRFSDGILSQPIFERTTKNGGLINKQLYIIED